jgi:hypothetical protein
MNAYAIGTKSIGFLAVCTAFAFLGAIVVGIL